LVTADTAVLGPSMAQPTSGPQQAHIPFYSYIYIY
jgi:hypothetical protein